MSRFRILRLDNFDPVSVGRKNRIMYAIYGAIPSLFIIAFNLGHYGAMSYGLKLGISIPILGLIYFLLLKKMRSTINNLKPIGEIEITQSCLKKRIGDSSTEYNFHIIKELKLIKHIPTTRVKESKSGYFSFIMKIGFYECAEESLIVSDRSVDHDHKLSILGTVKTLKKIAPFNVIIEI
jgi:hypothetical protein